MGEFQARKEKERESVMASSLEKLPVELQERLQEALTRILPQIRPQVVVLFGSWAEGRSGEESDVDILVVAETESPFQVAARLWEPVRTALWPQRVDLVVITPEQWEKFQHIPGQLVHEAAHYGVRLYEAA